MFCSCLYAALSACVLGMPVEAMASIQQALTMHTQVGTESNTQHVTAPTTQPTLWCHFVNPPPTSATSHCTASPPGGQCLETELQHLKLCFVGKMMPQKLTASSEKSLKKTCKHYWYCPINVNSWIFDFRSFHMFALLTAQQCKSTFKRFLLCRIINKNEVHSFKYSKRIFTKP